MTYILIDTMNLFWRSRHIAQGDVDSKIGLCYHIIFNCIKQIFNDFHGTHVVFFLEGKSWRKDIYIPYKKNRIIDQTKLTQSEIEDNKLFRDAYDDLTKYLDEKTNCTVLREENSEADDLIARWIYNHPDNNHIIISNDSDFYQLINKKVSMYNGITNQHITIGGVFDLKGNAIIDKKTDQPKTIDPPFLLFEKCIRGDRSDNIFSAYPGVKKKGTKNKIGIIDAYNDKEKQGFAWNNFMLQKWTDHNKNEHIVRDDYNRNKILIDLNAQPDYIKKACDKKITELVQKKNISQVGIHFLRFCKKHDLQKLSEYPNDYARFLNQSYR